MSYDILKQQDPELYAPFMKELERQRSHIELIASENFTSRAVMEAMGSHLTNKYAEGYSGARYYGGCEFIDEVETLAIERAKKLFGVEFANVQPHSGAQANTAVYAALLTPGDTIMGLDLSHGGHLTHGSKASISGRWEFSTRYAIYPRCPFIFSILPASCCFAVIAMVAINARRIRKPSIIMRITVLLTSSFFFDQRYAPMPITTPMPTLSTTS